MSHPYSNAAGYIYANEYEAPFNGRQWISNANDQPSVGKPHYDIYNPPLPAKRLEIDPRNSGDRGTFDRNHIVRPAKESYAARAMRPSMTSVLTATTRTSSNLSPFSRASSLPTRTTSNHSHDNPILAVKYTQPKQVHTPYDPFAYNPGVYDTQDFIHTDDPPEVKSKFPFKFKLTLPSAFRFRGRPRSPTSSWPPNFPLRDTFPVQRTATTTTKMTTNGSPCPFHVGRAVTAYDNDDDPSSSHWRWSSFDSWQKPSSSKLTRWFSKTKSKTFMKSLAPPRPSTYHTPSQNAHQERHTFPTRKTSGHLHRDTMRGKTTKGSLRFAQDAVRNRLGPGTGRRAEKDLRFSMVDTP